MQFQGISVEAVNHALMQDDEKPSIVDLDYGKSAKKQETNGCRHSLNLDAKKFAAPVDQGPPPNKDPISAKVSACRSKHCLN